MAFQGGLIRRRVVLVGAVRASVLVACGLVCAAGSTAVINGRYQKLSGRLRVLTAGQSWWPFEVGGSGNRHGPAVRPAR